MNKCKNCAGQIIFNPSKKGNECKNCGSVFSVRYNKEFKKNSFDQAADLDKEKLNRELKQLTCNSCGASILIKKNQFQAKCAYCGRPALAEFNKYKLTNIDSVVPFSFGKAEALEIFRSKVSRKAFCNKKIFKKMSEKDLVGAYINAFVFDFAVTATYSGVFSYTRTVTDSEGNTTTRTIIKHVNGTHNATFENLTVEANSNFSQADLKSIEPFEYGSAVCFCNDFMNGYMLEYKDSSFNDCLNQAEQIINSKIKTALLRKHNCERIVSIDLSLTYLNKKYNYCLLPVYFFTTTDKKKNKSHKVVMNGQTGKVGKLPLSAGKILSLVFGILGAIGLTVLMCLLLI